MESYGYVAPSSIAEVLAVLNESTSAGQMTQVLAGGSDVLVQMRMPNHQPRTIVDIKKLAETNRLEVSAEGIYIGAAVSSAVMNEHQGLREAMPGLMEAGDLIGSTQVQGRATICGNLCNRYSGWLPPDASRRFCRRCRQKCPAGRRVSTRRKICDAKSEHKGCVPALYP